MPRSEPVPSSSEALARSSGLLRTDRARHPSDRTTRRAALYRRESPAQLLLDDGPDSAPRVGGRSDGRPAGTVIKFSIDVVGRALRLALDAIAERAQSALEGF